MSLRIQDVCDYLESLFIKNNYKIIYPILSKGSTLIEKSKEYNDSIFSDIEIIPIDAHSKEQYDLDINNGLVFDDTSYSGKTIETVLSLIIDRSKKIDVCCFIVSDGVNSNIDYYKEVIPKKVWMKNNKIFDLKNMKIDMIPYKDIYPTFYLLSESNIDKYIANYLLSNDYNKSELETPNTIIYEKSYVYKMDSICNDDMNILNYIYIQGNKIYISSICDEEMTIKEICQNKSNKYHKFKCLNCTIINHLHSKIIPLIQSLITLSQKNNNITICKYVHLKYFKNINSNIDTLKIKKEFETKL